MGGFSGNPIDPHMMAIISALSNNIGSNAPPGMFPDASVSGAMGQGPQVQGSPIQGSIPEQPQDPSSQLMAMLGGQSSPDIYSQSAQVPHHGGHHILAGLLRGLGGAAQASLQGGSDALNHSLGLPTQYQKGLTQQELDLRRQQIQALTGYRQGQLGINQQKADAQTTGANARALAAEAAKRQHFAVLGLDENGDQQEESAMAPAVRAKVSHMNALDNLLKAKTDVENMQGDPNSVPNKMKMEAFRIAQERVNATLAGLGVKKDSLGLRQQQFERDTFGTVGGKGVPGAAVDQSGAPMGFKAPLAPTATTKSSGQFASTLLPHIDDIRQQISNLDSQGKLGPLAGRWNEFMAGKVGGGDPDVSKLRTEMGLLQTGLMRAHVGARGGVQLMQKFQNMVDTGKMNPANLNSALDGIESFLKGYVKAGQGSVLPPTSGGARNGSKSQGGASGIKTADDYLGKFKQ